MMRRFALLFLALGMALLLFPAGSSECSSIPVPRDKTIAVLVKGNASHAAAARAILVKSLIEGGYRAVDEKQLERIRQNKAAALALEGNVDAILRLGRTYGFSFLLSGSLSVPRAVQNEFGLFTATATISVTVCGSGDGKQVFAETGSAKEIGYTPDEAGQKAAEAAARSLRDVILGKREAGKSGSPASKIFVVASPLRSFAEAHAVVEICVKAGASSASLLRFSAGRAEVEAEFRGSPDQFLAALLRAGSGFEEESVEGNTIRLKKE